MGNKQQPEKTLAGLDFREVFVEERLEAIETAIRYSKGQSAVFESLNKQREALEEWYYKDWNSLYRALWFHANFPEEKPQVETHPVALMIYPSLYDDVEYKKGALWIKDTESEISADLMNGWHLPLKRFFGFPVKDTVIAEILENMKKIMEKNNVHEKNNDAVVNWLSEKAAEIYEEIMGKKAVISSTGQSWITHDSCNVFLEFLDVVYTIGNFSPIPTGGCQGYGYLDNWAEKLYKNLYEDLTPKSKSKSKWENFIKAQGGQNEQCGGQNEQRERFLNSYKFIWTPNGLCNIFDGYINAGYISPSGKPAAYWRKPGKPEYEFRPPEDEGEWKEYFTKTKKLITERANALLLGKRV